MIPMVIPPLSDLRVLVTRPAQQAAALCASINNLGGEAIPFAVLDIQPRAHTLMQSSYDLVIFISANAVLHGVSLLQQLGAPQIAAIGNATATALQSAGVDVGIIAPAPFNTEALLMHEKLQSPPNNILIIRGTDGRER